MREKSAIKELESKMNKAIFEKFKKVIDRMENAGEIDLYEAFKEVGLRTHCCDADFKNDCRGNLYCSKCKKILIGS